ncbi:MAG TPA: hypothetical protein VIY69_06775 [Candidatus Acidoferrales bacterium]
MTRKQVDQFILAEIDSVPHLEALLLLWNSRPKQWSADEMSKALYLESDATQLILQDFQNRGFASSESNEFSYLSNPDRDRLIDSLDKIYRREIIRVSTMIHSKASPAVRAFARAFRLKRD